MAVVDSWDRTALALQLVALDPAGLGGAIIRMRESPARNAVLSCLQNTKKMPPTMTDDQLYGGLDISATLSSGHVVTSKGFLHDRPTVLLTMSERCPTDLAAKLSMALDDGCIKGLFALDEGADPDETCPPALADRLAFQIKPEGRMPQNWAPKTTGDPAGNKASIGAEQIRLIATLAARLGIESLRAPLLAVAAARANAILNARDKVNDDDVEIAASLVYPHRATQIPEDAQDTAPLPPEEAQQREDEGTSESTDAEIPQGDLLIEAIKALLPPDLLARLAQSPKGGKSSSAGAGGMRKGNRRGRPIPPRQGRLDGRSRIDLVSTLRSAAPWQPLRRRKRPEHDSLLIEPSDIRLKRFVEQSDRLLIFVVDASGSAAVSRLNEAKGAIELLLGQAYASRDHVALISFRGDGAELLLPPTRSLVQTKKRLAALPGGGGTPLASGLRDAGLLAQQAKSKGLTPTIILLTDGRANVALDGTPDRPKAAADAQSMARQLRHDGVEALVIDMGRRPEQSLAKLGEVLGAPYLALPRADAKKLTQTVSAALAH
ncbi:MAG: magnesium chelatase subunit D [Paracoccaceae bacterium]